MVSIVSTRVILTDNKHVSHSCRSEDDDIQHPSRLVETSLQSSSVEPSVQGGTAGDSLALELAAMKLWELTDDVDEDTKQAPRRKNPGSAACVVDCVVPSETGRCSLQTCGDESRCVQCTSTNIDCESTNGEEGLRGDVVTAELEQDSGTSVELLADQLLKTQLDDITTHHPPTTDERNVTPRGPTNGIILRPVDGGQSSKYMRPSPPEPDVPSSLHSPSIPAPLHPAVAPTQPIFTSIDHVIGTMVNHHSPRPPIVPGPTVLHDCRFPAWPNHRTVTRPPAYTNWICPPPAPQPSPSTFDREFQPTPTALQPLPVLTAKDVDDVVEPNGGLVRNLSENKRFLPIPPRPSTTAFNAQLRPFRDISTTVMPSARTNTMTELMRSPAAFAGSSHQPRCSSVIDFAAVDFHYNPPATWPTQISPPSASDASQSESYYSSCSQTSVASPSTNGCESDAQTPINLDRDSVSPASSRRTDGEPSPNNSTVFNPSPCSTDHLPQPSDDSSSPSDSDLLDYIIDMNTKIKNQLSSNNAASTDSGKLLSFLILELVGRVVQFDCRSICRV